MSDIGKSILRGAEEALAFARGKADLEEYRVHIPDEKSLPLTPEQKEELDWRLDACEEDGDLGRPAADVIGDIRRKLKK